MKIALTLNIGATRAVVVAQLVERLLLTPEIRGSNPEIGEILSTNCTIEMSKINKKRLGMALHKKIIGATDSRFNYEFLISQNC